MYGHIIYVGEGKWKYTAELLIVLIYKMFYLGNSSTF